MAALSPRPVVPALPDGCLPDRLPHPPNAQYFLKRCGLANVYYLVEGEIDTLHSGAVGCGGWRGGAVR